MGKTTKKECENLEHVVTMQGTTLLLDYPRCSLLQRKCAGASCPFHPEHSKRRQRKVKRNV